ncbi:MAG: peptidylprolyl isomerase [Acidobacteria bacterium]|nr:peptidylprolyl isomerase [Acidobacteriota bacterium]
MIRRNLMCLFAIIAVLCFSIPAQESKSPVAPSPKASSATPVTSASPDTQAAPAAKEEKSDLVVLTVFGEPVTEKQVLTAISLLAREKQAPSNPGQPRNVTLFMGAIDNIISSAALKNQAKELNIDSDPARTDQQIESLKKQFPSPEEFQKALAAQNTSEAQLRKNVEDSIKMQRVIDHAVKDVPPAGDDDIAKFYENNPKSFASPDRVHAAHILLLVDRKATPEQKEEIRKKIEGIRADIEAGKITFEDAAKNFSQDKGTVPRGGDLGFFGRGNMVKPFEDAAFAGEPGTLTPVIESEYGFHVIKIIEKKSAGTISLEEAKPQIKQYLDQQNKRRVMQQYVKDLKAKAAVENFMTAEEFLKRHPEVK